MRNDFGESGIPKHVLVLAWLNPIWFLDIPIEVEMLYLFIAVRSLIASKPVTVTTLWSKLSGNLGMQSDLGESGIPKHLTASLVEPYLVPVYPHCSCRCCAHLLPLDPL